MLINIRQGIFESNSSSTHSMVIGMEDDFKKWKAGELLYYRSYNYPNGFYTKEEAITKLNSDLKDFHYKTLKEYSYKNNTYTYQYYRIGKMNMFISEITNNSVFSTRPTGI